MNLTINNKINLQLIFRSKIAACFLFIFFILTINIQAQTEQEPMTTSNKQTNPLLQKQQLPDFAKIQAQHFKPAIEYTIKHNNEKIKELLTQKKFTWENLIEPLSILNEDITSLWATISHFNAVLSTKAIQATYAECLPLITNYATTLAQSTDLYNAILKITKSNKYKNLNAVQQRIIDKMLLDFQLAGVNLPPKKKKEFLQLSQKLADLSNKYDHNVLAATQGWSICLNKNQIKGLPESALALGIANAKTKNKKGWCYSLDYPSYSSLITFADSRNIRKKSYIAYATQASEVGPNANKWNNNPIVRNIISIRYKLAKLVGYNTYAQYSLATKTAKSPDQVIKFINHLATSSLPTAKKELHELKSFAKKQHTNNLEPWDITYYREKLFQKKFNLSQEDFRPYFPANQVLSGLFTLINKLFHITIIEKADVSKWHSSVRFFEVYDTQKNLRGQLYMDLYSRENKYSGAWMNSVKTRFRKSDGTIQTPLAFLVCNFMPSSPQTPALLTHDDVITFFHEFGHALHHMLSLVDYPEVSGVNNYPWDVVELPSQFLENWAWQAQVLNMIGRHYKDQSPIPPNMVTQLLASKNYFAAIDILRQARLGLIDFRIYSEFNPKKKNQIKTIENEVNDKFNLLPLYKNTRLLNFFSHIFPGGYAAGYYSYHWAEVLSTDAFAKFEENGLFDKKTGTDFLHYILESGNSQDPIELFKKFRGRDADPDILLRKNGII